MPKVIIVEDEESHSKTLARLCSRYQQERGVELDTAVHDNPLLFLQVSPDSSVIAKTRLCICAECLFLLFY